MTSENHEINLLVDLFIKNGKINKKKQNNYFQLLIFFVKWKKRQLDRTHACIRTTDPQIRVQHFRSSFSHF